MRTPPASAALRDLGWCRFALTQGFLQTLKGDGETNLAAMPETVGNSLLNAEHLYRYTFDQMVLYAFGKQVVRETQHADREVARLWRPIVPADRHPHLVGKLICESVEGKR